MLTDDSLKKYDKRKIHEFYDSWPKYARESFEYHSKNSHLLLRSIRSKTEKDCKYSDIDHIVFAGMGGSGAIGDLFSAILSETNIHVSVIKGYLLPKTVDVNTLVIATSVSGNTIETLTILKAARKVDCKIIAFSSGGKMEEFCMEHHIEFGKIEKIHSPRVSFVKYVYSILGILQEILPIKKEDIYESIKQIENIRNDISSKNLTLENPALSLAEWITGIPMIYYPSGLQAAAIRFKNSLQENAKRHTISEDVIEACHNGVVAWEKPNENVKPILIEGTDDYVKTKERWKILKEYFDEKNIEYIEVHTIQGNILSKIMHMIYFFDYVTIYNAVLSEIDPSPTNPIDYIKKRTLD